MRAPNIKLRQMRAFAFLAHHGSFRAAASAFHLSQSGLSEAIRQMEVQLGTPLFDRSTRHVEMTATGRRLLPEVTRILAELDALMLDAKAPVAEVDAQVVVASIFSIATQILPQVVARLQVSHPHIHVQVLDFTASQVQNTIRANDADIGICAHNDLDADMAFQFLATDPFVAVLPLQHPLANLTRVPWSALVEHPFIAMARGSHVRTLIDSNLERCGLVVTPAHEASQPTTIQAMVAASIGIAVLPQSTLASDNPRVTIRPLASPTLERRLGVVSRADGVMSLATVAFRSELASYMTELRK